MGRWIIATGLALSALVNIVVLARLGETRREVDELRRRPRPTAPAVATPPSTDGRAEPVPYSAQVSRAEPLREPGRNAPATSPSSTSTLLDDLERIDAFWNTLLKLDAHRDALGDDYERDLMEVTAAFLGVDTAVLHGAAKQAATDRESAQTDEAYAAASLRVTSLLRPERLRTHRSFVAKVDEWLCSVDTVQRPLSGRIFQLEKEK